MEKQSPWPGRDCRDSRDRDGRDGRDGGASSRSDCGTPHRSGFLQLGGKMPGAILGLPPQ